MTMCPHDTGQRIASPLLRFRWASLASVFAIMLPRRASPARRAMTSG